MSASLALVDIHTRFAISSKTCSANTFVRAVSVHALDAISYQTAVIVLFDAFVNVLARAAIALKTFVAATNIALPSVNTGSLLMAAVNAKFAFVRENTVFYSITYITLFAFAFVSTRDVHALAE